MVISEIVNANVSELEKLHMAVDNYFALCIKDAYAKEKRTLDWDRVSYFFIIVENNILSLIHTPYERITRAVVSRINKNIEKNFGLNPNGHYFLDTQLQVNLVCNCFTINKKKFFLCRKIDFDKAERGEVMASERYERLVKAYYNITTEELKQDLATGTDRFLPDMSWSEYRETYFEAYNKYPEIAASMTCNNVFSVFTEGT